MPIRPLDPERCWSVVLWALLCRPPPLLCKTRAAPSTAGVRGAANPAVRQTRASPTHTPPPTSKTANKQPDARDHMSHSPHDTTRTHEGRRAARAGAGGEGVGHLPDLTTTDTGTRTSSRPLYRMTMAELPATRLRCRSPHCCCWLLVARGVGPGRGSRGRAHGGNCLSEAVLALAAKAHGCRQQTPSQS